MFQVIKEFLVKTYGRYFMRKVRSAVGEPFYEKYILKMLGIDKLNLSRSAAKALQIADALARFSFQTAL